MAKKSKNELKITLTDNDGVDHEFLPLQLFRVGKKDYALLKPVKGPRNELTILKFKLDKKGEAEGFSDPTEKEFQEAVEFLESADGECACGCEDEAGCCGGEAEAECCCCGGEEEEAPAKKTAKSAKSKPAKNVVAKKAAPKKAAKKAAPAAKPAAKKAAAKKPAKKTAKRARA